MPEFPPMAPRERRRFRAEVPQAAWPQRRQPKERATRKAARADLLRCLCWHVERNVKGTGAVGAHTPRFTSHDLARWVEFAFRAGAGDASVAPDGERFTIRMRVEQP